MSENPIRIDLLDGLNDPELIDLAAKLPRRRFPKGMVIFEKTERSDEVFVVVSGSVEIVDQDETNSLRQIAILQPGALFGEFSLLTGEPRSSSAIALEQCELIEIKSGWLQELGRRHPEIQERLTEIYRSRVLANILKRSKLFGGLNVTTLSAISSRMSFRQCADGEEIIKEGSLGLDLIVIKRGRVAVTKKRESDVIQLGELGPGDVFGEMAVVTGEARSASAHARGSCELMVLPGEDLRGAIEAYPDLLGSIEALVKSRAEETRKALDSVIADIIGETWSDVDANAGIQVSAMEIPLTLAMGERNEKGKLLAVSRRRWTIQTKMTEPLIAADTSMAISLAPNRLKDLAPFLKDSFRGSFVSFVDDVLTVQFEDTPEIIERTAALVTSLARARFRLFVYPEYDVSKLAIMAHTRQAAFENSAAEVLRMSQTNAFIQPVSNWPAGETTQIIFVRNDRELISTRALNLGTADGRQEIQFEYDTPTEKSQLEALLRDLSRELGFGQPASVSAEKGAKPLRFDIALTKEFPTSESFLKTFMGSIEGGLLNVEAKEKISRGMPVRVNASVASSQGTHRLIFTGLVRQWDAGVVVVELDDLSHALRDKIDQICRKLIEARSADSWEKRKRTLVSTAAHKGVAPSTPLWLKVGGLTLTVGIMIWLSVRSPSPSKVSSTALSSGEARLSESKRNEMLKLQTVQGSVTVRSSEVRSIKVKENGAGAVIVAGRNSYDVTQNGMTGFSEFQKRQLERWNAMHSKK